ncbi:MAG TPA: carboxypeptidase regulatory-like domain-containing protein [Gemmatimonadaceae bacterium]|nr:carboxypeptidase regulatory-like domain-containing protein [Gemmatimonadaceae bacterium]
MRVMRPTFPLRATLVALSLLLASPFASPLAAQRATPRKRPAAPAAKKPASSPPAPAAHLGRVTGVVEDSIHLTPLVGATVRVGATKRSATSDRGGRFTVDSVPPGDYDVVVSHPMLDSLYLAIAPARVHVVADSEAMVDIATPSLATLLGGDCPPATARLGPATFAGRVLDADSKEPAPNVRVVLVWMQLSAGSDIGLRQMPRVRTATTDARGYYRICGVPSDVDDATVQAERGRVKTAEVPAALGASLGLRSFLIGAPTEAGTVGRAVVTGHVVDTLGTAVEHAQVSVEGAAPVATTNARGDFSLDSLPSGTQALVVRRIGFAPSRAIVDLTAAAPARVAVRLERAVPRLQPVVTTAQAEALSRVGFEDRQKHGLGHFLGPDDLAKMQPQYTTSALRMMPGLQVVPSGGGGYTVRSSRDARGGGCVSFWVDGAPFREMEGGDLDNAFPANQIAAIETYQPSEVPAQFTAAGQSSCTTVVIWTQASMRRKR